jgi:hypothetical protein
LARNGECPVVRSLAIDCKDRFTLFLRKGVLVVENIRDSYQSGSSATWNCSPNAQGVPFVNLNINICLIAY